MERTRHLKCRPWWMKNYTTSVSKNGLSQFTLTTWWLNIGLDGNDYMLYELLSVQVTFPPCFLVPSEWSNTTYLVIIIIRLALETHDDRSFIQGSRKTLKTCRAEILQSWVRASAHLVGGILSVFVMSSCSNTPNVNEYCSVECLVTIQSLQSGMFMSTHTETIHNCDPIEPGFKSFALKQFPVLHFYDQQAYSRWSPLCDWTEELNGRHGKVLLQTGGTLI